MARQKNRGIFAAVGAATGLGNAFRFPALCAQYGGAFVLIYAAALVLVGFPLLCAELSAGLQKDGVRGKIYAVIITAATANSALIALYYGGIATKLASASMGYIFLGSPDCPAYITGLAAVSVLAAVCVVLCKGAAATGVSGKLSVCLSFALFIPLAVKGVASLNNVRFDFNVLASGAAWSDGVGQALLSLSVAAGVMPSFAASFQKGFSPVRTSAKIICANFCGCIFATLATLPFASGLAQGGVSVAFTVFPQVVTYLSQNALISRTFGAFVFAVLAVVAVHSLCSLAYPSVKLLAPRLKFFPILFGISAVALSPLFTSGDCQTLNCCDRVACCVTAVIISVAESFCFAQSPPKGATVILTRFICPPCCIIAAFTSLCSARFSGFSAISIAFGVTYALIPLFCALYSVKKLCLADILKRRRRAGKERSAKGLF